LTDDLRTRIAEVRKRLHAGNLPGNAPELRWLADEADRLIDEVDRVSGELAELTEAKYHGAYVDCGHMQTVTMAAFGRKISEKRQAMAERDACLTEANRAREAEQAALGRVAELEAVVTWDTTCGNCARLLDSSYTETVRAEQAEAAAQRVRAVAVPPRDTRFPQEYYDGWADALAAVRDATEETM
jgi:bacterioferritin-associated ferredoxin